MFGLLEGSGLVGLHSDDITRTLPHLAIDWPGHNPNGGAIVGVLVAARADVRRPPQRSSRSVGPGCEAWGQIKSAGGGLWHRS